MPFDCGLDAGSAMLDVLELQKQLIGMLVVAARRTHGRCRKARSRFLRHAPRRSG